VNYEHYEDSKRREREKLLKEEIHIEKGEEHALYKIAHELHEIAGILKISGMKARSLVVQIHDLEGNTLMPATLTVGQTAQAVAVEFSGLAGAGSIIPNAGPIAWASSDVTIATVDAASGLVTSVAAGTATITGTDSVNGLSGSDTVSDTAVTAQSMVVTVTANAPAFRR
jgi:hypothetical protein